MDVNHIDRKKAGLRLNSQEASRAIVEVQKRIRKVTL